MAERDSTQTAMRSRMRSTGSRANVDTSPTVRRRTSQRAALARERRRTLPSAAAQTPAFAASHVSLARSQSHTGSFSGRNFHCTALA
ncbi:MAG: DUF630 domain-containing protein [Kiritimatiellae bacterium]|nr:DUF630 domain-containing protein [Kiritimatiellia bacterium]